MFRSIGKLPRRTKINIRGPIGGLQSSRRLSVSPHLYAARPPPTGPISKKIYDKLRGGRSRLNGDAARINVVSSELCQDVIERLAPSLEKYKGCDIIDVNPGACVWSSCLHEHLKPRTHLLLEHDTSVYEQFYNPLLEKDGSTYKLIPKSGIIWNTWDSISEHLPQQELLADGDPRRELPNDTLLFTANLARVRKPSDRMRVAHMFIHQLMSAGRNHTIFQKYGLIRMLVWVEDSERMIIVPRVISQRKKYTVECELSCESIVEVASQCTPKGDLLREHHLELERAMEMVKKMESAGLKTPVGRAGELELKAIEKLKEPNQEAASAKMLHNIPRPYLKELKELETGFRSGEFAEFIDPTTVKKIRNRKSSRTEEFLRMQRLSYRYNYESKQYGELQDHISQYMSLLAKEEALSTLPANKVEGAKEEIKKLWEEFHASMGTHEFNYRDQFILRIEDRRAFYSNPPLLYHDRRPYEPLKVKAEEFYPEDGLTLLDFQPKSIHPVFRPQTNYDHFEYILSTFFSSPTQSVAKGMETLAPGAKEWIIPECPSLTDITKGGNPNPELFRIRQLTQEQLTEIMVSWMNWPFRPTFEQIMARMGFPAILEDDDIRPGRWGPV